MLPLRERANHTVAPDRNWFFFLINIIAKQCYPRTYLLYMEFPPETCATPKLYLSEAKHQEIRTLSRKQLLRAKEPSKNLAVSGFWRDAIWSFRPTIKEGLTTLLKIYSLGVRADRNIQPWVGQSNLPVFYLPKEINFFVEDNAIQILYNFSYIMFDIQKKISRHIRK